MVWPKIAYLFSITTDRTEYSMKITSGFHSYKCGNAVLNSGPWLGNNIP